MVIFQTKKQKSKKKNHKKINKKKSKKTPIIRLKIKDHLNYSTMEGCIFSEGLNN
jgi:hypothetical protein